MRLNGPVTTLILGGTREGRELAEILTARGEHVITSLAGRVGEPATVAGEVRTGGFGGASGLAAWLLSEDVSHVVDATHPFAERISANAVEACRQAGVPLLRIARPSWMDHPLAGTWHWVASHDEAAELAARHDRVLLTVGKQSLDRYRHVGNVVARMVEAPAAEGPHPWRLLLDRGPFSLEDERQLLATERITALVTKDSGGSLTEPKLRAADELGVDVIIIRRAPTPPDLPQVPNVSQAADWLTKHSR